MATITPASGWGRSAEVRVNKSELIDTIADQVGGRAAATRAVDAVVESIQRAVTRGERVVITGFGVFERAERAARIGRNPATNQPMRLKKSVVPKFRAGTEFKAYVAGVKKFAKVTGASAASRAAASPVARSVASRASGLAATAGTARPARPTPAKAAAKATAKAPARPAAKAPAKAAAKASARPAAKAVRTARSTTAAPAKAATKAPARAAAKAPAKAAGRVVR